MGKDGEELNRHFGFDSHLIDIVILSHAHIDHSGLLPKLVKDGFKEKIYITEATFEICEILLKDSAKIQEDDVRFINKKRVKKDKKKIEPLYDSEDIVLCLER